MGIKNRIRKAGTQAGNKIAKLAVLSPEQLESVEKQREKYLTEMPDPNDPQAVELTQRLLAANGVEIYNAYLSQLDQLYLPIDKKIEYNSEFRPSYNIRYFKITKWVTDKKENSLEKLVNVYEVLANEDCNIALIFHRSMTTTDVYLAVTNIKNDYDNHDVSNYKKRIIEAIHGNFPGAEWQDAEGSGIVPCLNNHRNYSVATASNIPTEKSEKFISQTIEKLLDGIVPDRLSKEYTIILLATPVHDIEERKLRLSEFYTGLAPYAGWSTNYTYQESGATSSSATVGINVGTSAGIQHGQNQGVTNTMGTSDTKGSSDTSSRNVGESLSTTDGKTRSKSATMSVAGLSGTVGTSTNSSLTKGTSNSVGRAVANTLGKAVSKSVATTSGLFSAVNLGVNFGASFARSSSVTEVIGKNEGITQQHTNYNIKHTLELLEEQMKRYEQSTALGMWDFAAYVLSEDHNVANNVAHSYLALTQGEKSYMSHAAINLWRGDLGERSKSVNEICDYLRELRHPIFGLNAGIVEQDSSFNVYPPTVTATTCLTGKELAYSLNFPRKSITGLPVLDLLPVFLY